MANQNPSTQPSGDSDHWTGVAEQYRALTTGVARKPIAALLTAADTLRPFSTATAIHDNGAGPGPVLAALIGRYGAALTPGCALSASDRSPAMVAELKKTRDAAAAAAGTGPEAACWARVRAEEFDAMDLKGIPDGSLSHVTAGWVYFMTDDPGRCVRESVRVLEEGGVLAVSSWKGTDWWSALEAVYELRPEATRLAVPDEWRDVELLKRELEAEGLRDVQTHEVPTEMAMTSYKNMADVFLAMPQVKALNLTEEEKVIFVKRATEELKKASPQEPGTLHGTTLIGVGRK